MFVFLQRKGVRDCEGSAWGEKGGEEREGEGGSRNVFCKECLIIKRTRCNFLCWLGSLGENVGMVCEEKRIV